METCPQRAIYSLGKLAFSMRFWRSSVEVWETNRVALSLILVSIKEYLRPENIMVALD